jgi:hypothetical protein
MRVMPITQQNLNNRPYVQNNQPNFKGLFVRENLLALERVFPKGSVGAKVLDVFEQIVNKCTNRHFHVTVEPMPKNEANLVMFFEEGLSDGGAMQNLKITWADKKPEAKKSFTETVGAYVDEERDVNTNISNIMKNLLDQFGDYINWEGIAAALEKG